MACLLQDIIYGGGEQQPQQPFRLLTPKLLSLCTLSSSLSIPSQFRQDSYPLHIIMFITSRRLTAAALLAMTGAQAAVNVFERKPSAGPAPGDCQIFTEGQSELTLCLNKKNPDGGEVAVLNGVLFNSGKTDLCNIKLEARGAAGTVQVRRGPWGM